MISNNKKRVAVGMSGGTDSSAVAAMLVDEGYDVIGLTANNSKLLQIYYVIDQEEEKK